MFCPECGAEMDAAARSCTECGEQIPPTEPSEPVDVTGDGDANEMQSGGGLVAKLPGINADNTRRRNVIVGGAYALAGCTALGAAIPSDSEGDNDDGNAAATESDPEDGLRQRARDGYDEGGFGDEIREIQVLDAVENSYSVNTRYDLRLPGDPENDEFDANHMAIEINKRLYRSEYPILQTGTFAYVTVQDQYGNQSDEVLHKVTIKRETANRINWENIVPKNVPDVADGYQFRRELY